jgi:uncharacterized glyoxalase superfamily protein PhnB
METVSPNIFVDDLQSTIAYYQSIEFQVVTTVPDETGEIIFALLVNGAVTFMLQTIKSLKDQLPLVHRQNGGSLLLYVKMKGIRSFFERVKDKANIISGLERTFYGAVEFSVVDPNGFVLTFAEDEPDSQ